MQPRILALLTILATSSSIVGQGDWTELYKGKAEFGYVTGVHWVKGKLFFLDSPIPAGSDGGDVYIWDLESGRARRVLQVREQGVTTIREIGSKLAIPGTDAMESWDLGNLYVSLDKGDSWQKVRTIPVGVHIWDVCEWRDKLYTSTGSVRDGFGYGAVCESDDGGRTWKESLMAYPPDRKEKNQFARCYALIPTPDGLYASFVARDSQKTVDTPERDFYRFDGRAWSPIKLLPERVGTPYFGLRHREFGDAALIMGRPNSYLLRGGKVHKLKGLEERTTFMATLAGADDLYAVASSADGKSSKVYRASLKSVLAGTGGFVEAFDLPEGQEAIAIEAARGGLYVGTRSKDGGRLLRRSLR